MKRWFEVTENGGVHANTGIRLVKGERHFLEESLVGGFRGEDEDRKFVCSKFFREVDGPHRQEKKETLKPESKNKGDT